MSEFNGFGGNPQGDGQNGNTFGSTPEDTNNFGGQSFDSQNFGGQNFGGQNFGGQSFGGQGSGGQNFGGQGFGGQNFDSQNFGGQCSGGQNFGGQCSGGQNFGGQGFGQNNGGSNYSENNGVDLNNISLWKTLSIIQIIIGCCGGFIPALCGIISLVFMSKSKNALLMKDIINASANFKTGKVFNLIGWGILALGIIFNILAFIFGAFEAIFS